MAIRRAPLKTDSPGKCSRWWVKIYNPAAHKHEMHTVRGTLKEAQAYEREAKSKLAAGTFIARTDRKTVQGACDLWLAELEARARRTSTVTDYVSSLSLYILPKFGPRELSAVRKADLREHFNALRADGKSTATVNKAIRAFKALLNFALDSEWVDRNPLARFRPFEKVKGERRVKRGAFTEAEVRAILEAAKPRDRALIGLLCFTGMRPGEVYALDWHSVDLAAGRLEVRRSWDHRGGRFVDPKTKAGARLVPLSPWVVGELRAHRASTEVAPDALVFATRQGTPLNPSNVRRDIWLPLKARAKVRDLDLYSLRHTFVTYARAGGADSFNVARAIGHAKSSIVDSVYGNHTLDSGVAPLSASVTARALGNPTGHPAPSAACMNGVPAPSSPASVPHETRRRRPTLRLVAGGK